jgi:hypothetical protein
VIQGAKVGSTEAEPVPLHDLLRGVLRTPCLEAEANEGVVVHGNMSGVIKPKCIKRII